MELRDYYDERGIPRKVALPDGYTGDPKRGIPVSLNIDSLYDHMPVAFLQRLYPELWRRGIVTAQDALKPGGAGAIRAAILAVIDHDALNIQGIAKGVLDNGNRTSPQPNARP